MYRLGLLWAKVSNPLYKTTLAVCLLAGNCVCLAPACFSQSIAQGDSQSGNAHTLGQSDWQGGNQGSSQYQSGSQSQSLGQSEWQNTAPQPAFSQAPGLTTNAAQSNPAGYGSGFASGYGYGSVPQPSSSASQAPTQSLVQPYVQSGTGSSSGQSLWQNVPSSMNQNQPGSQLSSQSAWQNSAGNAGLGLSPWQQPPSSFQANTVQNPNAGQQSSDYYYGQINPQQNTYGSNPGQYQGNANYPLQPNNQSFNNAPAVSGVPQHGYVQKSHDGLKKTMADIGKAASQAAGVGLGIAAPFAGMYLMSKAMTSGYGYPSMPYGFGYPGMMSYPNYAMMNMAPMYTSALNGLSSFMSH